MLGAGGNGGVEVESLRGFGVLGVLDGGFDEGIHGLAVFILHASVESVAVLLGNADRGQVGEQGQQVFNGSRGGDTNFILHRAIPFWFLGVFLLLLLCSSWNIFIVSHLAVFVKGFLKLFSSFFGGSFPFVSL
jgi:hypothetical protein